MGVSRSALELLLMAALAAGCAQAPGARGSPGEPGASAPPALTGYDGTWYWMGTLTASSYAAPDVPSRYTLVFGKDEALAVSADCHRVRTRYTLEGRTLHIAPVAALQQPCPSETSSASEFARQLEAAGPARIADGLLELTSGAGTMVFSRRPNQRLANFRCTTGGAMVTLLSQDAALVRWQQRSFKLTRVASPAGVRYRGDGAELSSRGPEAVLDINGKTAAAGCTLARSAH